MILNDRACPACHRSGTYRPVSARDFWERVFFPFFGLTPFGCRNCGRRALLRRKKSFSSKVNSGSKTGKDISPPPGLPAENNQSFQELILDMQDAEKRMQLEAQSTEK
jgi:hypothetical protein